MSNSSSFHLFRIVFSNNEEIWCQIWAMFSSQFVNINSGIKLVEVRGNWVTDDKPSDPLIRLFAMFFSVASRVTVHTRNRFWEHVKRKRLFTRIFMRGREKKARFQDKSSFHKHNSVMIALALANFCLNWLP